MTGKLVKYANPESGEENLTFKVLEDRGDRLLVEWVCDWLIKPTHCFAKSEFVELK